MLLELLSNARGVSGDESAVRALIAKHIQLHVDEYRVDAMGNLIALKKASVRRRGDRTLRVLVAAHMDEVGLIITRCDSQGYLHFEKVGGIDDRVLPSQIVLIGDRGIPGVIGLKPRHLTEERERQQVVPAEELVIDIGAKSEQDAYRYVQPGDYATFNTRFSRIGSRVVRGKALDDRVGCALLAELVRYQYPVDLYAVFTAQEELGSRGARAAGHMVGPDIALVLEATVCDDSPKQRDVSPVTRLGSGPALTLADRRLIADKRMVKLLEETATRNKIPYQFKQPLVGSTDGAALHLARAGVPTAVVSVPARYIHSSASLVSLVDYRNAFRLSRAFLAQLAENW